MRGFKCEEGPAPLPLPMLMPPVPPMFLLIFKRRIEAVLALNITLLVLLLIVFALLVCGAERSKVPVAA